MKTLFKFSVILALLLALLPTAFAKGRSKTSEVLRPSPHQSRGNVAISPKDARAVEDAKRNQALSNALTFGVGRTESRVNLEQIDLGLDVLSEVSSVRNGTIEVVRDFMGVPTRSNVRISAELIDMSRANRLKAEIVAGSLRFVANIKGTAFVTNNGVASVTAGNVVRAVGYNLNKARSWAVKPKTTYFTFVNAFNTAKKDGAGNTRALETAIMTAFGIKGKKLEAKKREILEYCRV